MAVYLIMLWLGNNPIYEGLSNIAIFFLHYGLNTLGGFCNNAIGVGRVYTMIDKI